MKTVLIAVLLLVVAVIVALFVLTATVVRKHIKKVGERAQQKTFQLKSLQTDVELLTETEIRPDAKAALQALAEQLCFSDPMSGEALAPLEQEISEKIAALKAAEDKAQTAAEISRLLDERNKKCKILK